MISEVRKKRRKRNDGDKIKFEQQWNQYLLYRNLLEEIVNQKDLVYISNLETNYTSLDHNELMNLFSLNSRHSKVHQEILEFSSKQTGLQIKAEIYGALKLSKNFLLKNPDILPPRTLNFLQKTPINSGHKEEKEAMSNILREVENIYESIKSCKRSLKPSYICKG